MSVRWYCLAFGLELGPMSWDDLFERATRGDLGPEDQVRCGDAGAWVAAETVAGLFDLAGESSAPADGWYCEILGAELGPMPFDELKLLAERGNLRADNRVCREGGDWAPASQIAGLLVRQSAPRESPESDFVDAKSADADWPRPTAAEPHASEPHVSELSHVADRLAAETPAAASEQAPKPKHEQRKTERSTPIATPRRASMALRIPGRAIAALGGVAAAAGLVYVGYLAFGKLQPQSPDYRQVAGAYRQVYDELKRFRETPNPQAEVGLRFQFSRHVAGLRKQFEGALPDSEQSKLGQAGAQLAAMLGNFNALPGSPQAKEFAESERRFLTLMDGVRPGPAPEEASH